MKFLFHLTLIAFQKDFYIYTQESFLLKLSFLEMTDNAYILKNASFVIFQTKNYKFRNHQYFLYIPFFVCLNGMQQCIFSITVNAFYEIFKHKVNIFREIIVVFKIKLKNNAQDYKIPIHLFLNLHSFASTCRSIKKIMLITHE